MNEENNNSFSTPIPPTQENEIKITELDNQTATIDFITKGSSLKKKKNPFITVSITLTILVIIGLISYFMIYPYIIRTYFQDPKKVFETTIKSITEEINANIKEKHTQEILNLSFLIDTDIKEFHDYTGYTYSAHLGQNSDKKNIEIGYGIENKEKKFTQNIYKKENKYYTKFSNDSDTLYFLEETEPVEELFSSLTEIINISDKLNNEDITYITNFFSSNLINSIEEEKLSKEKTTITMNGEMIKVTRNLYTMDEETQEKTKNYLCDAMLEDNKLLSLLSSFQKQDIETLKEKIKQIKNTKDNKDTKLISIYTYGNKAEIIGFAFDIENKINFHYYKHKDNFEIILSKETTEQEEKKNHIEIIGTKKKKVTDVVISIDKKEVLLLSIREWRKEKIDFDYTLLTTIAENLDDNISGTFLYNNEKNTNNSLHSFTLRINIENHYINLTVNLTCDWANEVSNINQSAAKGIDGSTYKEMQNNLMNHLIKETPLQIFFSTLSNSFDLDIYEYYEQENIINNNENIELSN